jgi:hypothetical protein
MTGLPTVEFAALLRKQFAAQCAPTDVFLELCHSGGIDPEKLSHVRDQLPEVWIAEANRLGLANIVTKTRDEPDCSAVRTINGKLIRAISSSNPSVAAFLDQLEIVTGTVPLDPASAAWIVRHFCEIKGWKPSEVAEMEVLDWAALIQWPECNLKEHSTPSAENLTSCLEPAPACPKTSEQLEDAAGVLPGAPVKARRHGGDRKSGRTKYDAVFFFYDKLKKKRANDNDDEAFLIAVINIFRQNRPNLIGKVGLTPDRRGAERLRAAVKRRQLTTLSLR